MNLTIHMVIQRELMIIEQDKQREFERDAIWNQMYGEEDEMLERLNRLKSDNDKSNDECDELIDRLRQLQGVSNVQPKFVMKRYAFVDDEKHNKYSTLHMYYIGKKSCDDPVKVQCVHGVISSYFSQVD